MKRPVLRRRLIALLVSILVLVIAAVVWVGAVEYWIGQQLRAFATARLNPVLAFDDLSYSFPRTIALRGVRLSSPDPEATGEWIEILATDSLSMALASIPWPEMPFRVQQVEIVGPTVRLVRTHEGEAASSLLGFSDLFKDEQEPDAPQDQSMKAISDQFQAREVSVRGGRVEFDPRDGGAPQMLVDGIAAELQLQPSDAGAYDIDFSLDHHPVLAFALRGKLLVDDERLEIDSLSFELQLAREQDHYLTPILQKLLAEGDIKGHLTLGATGMLALDGSDASHLNVKLELSDARYVSGDHVLALDHLGSQISLAGNTLSIDEFAIDALGGHASLSGSIELDEHRSADLTFEGADLQIGDLLRGADDPDGVPSFSGLLDFSGTLRGPLAPIDQHAQGQGRLSLRKARLANLPVLSTIDEALDRTAEAFMKREHTGHDALSLGFSFAGDRVHIEKLRMNSHWYGLRGHGDVFFASRLDLAVDGGPVQRVENELGALGDVLGEITETLVRARVTGTLAEPKVGIEILRHRLPH